MLFFVLGPARLALPGAEGTATEVTITLLGAILWLTGHCLFASRHHVYSPSAYS